jgi:methylenetetrahydrofolate reductase (NADPH)
MNLETAVINIIKGLGILDNQKTLPFKKPSTRLTEEVRPIFWAIKPKSYISRTQEWDEFPNGRWGVSRSPAFGEPEMYGSIAKKLSFNFDDLKRMYGENVSNYNDIAEVFISYLTGKIKKYPFSEGSLQLETKVILDPLVLMNRNYIFTINSQPKVNGVPSTDSQFGWGPKQGFVYQKAYYEFFIPRELLDPLIAHLNKYEMITYQAINNAGDERRNVCKNDVNAVTWGVFKAKEIIQPTVVDHTAFVIWKQEAFMSWLDHWGIIYGLDTPQFKFLERCQNNFYLVNVVDNDYITGDLNRVFADFIEENKELISSL